MECGPGMAPESPKNIAASAASGDLGPEGGQTPLFDSATQNFDALPQAAGIQPGGVGKQPDVVATRERAALSDDVTSLIFRQRSALPEARRRTLRAVLPAFLLAAVAISAYYVYRYPIHVTDWLGASRADPNAAPKAKASDTQTLSVPAQIGVALPPLAAGPGTDSASTSEAASTAPPFESSTEAKTSSASRSNTQATAPHGVDGEMPTTGAATTAGADSHYKRTRTAAKRAGPQTAANRSTAIYPPAAEAPPAKARPDACTEAVAALGLCNPRTKQ